MNALHMFVCEQIAATAAKESRFLSLLVAFQNGRRQDNCADANSATFRRQRHFAHSVSGFIIFTIDLLYFQLNIFKSKLSFHLSESNF